MLTSTQAGARTRPARTSSTTQASSALVLMLMLVAAIGSSPTADAFASNVIRTNAKSTSSSSGHQALLQCVVRLQGGGGGDGRADHGTTSRTALQASASSSSSSSAKVTTAIRVVPTSPISGMKPGTSGLRKKVEVWQEPHYLENFIQALIETAASRSPNQSVPDTILVAGDGRYYNAEAMQVICRVLAANGVRHIWVPQHGIMTTPAVSAAIRTRRVSIKAPDGTTTATLQAQGGIILTASHNPGGPGEDFGIKYNLDLGQPAGEEFTDDLYDRTLSIESYKTMDAPDMDWSAPIGTVYELGSGTTSRVTIIDPFDEYVAVLKSCFDFDALQKFAQQGQFSLLYDGMAGAGGPFARRVLLQELGLPESSLMRCDPKPDFDKGHPDPNLTYAAALVKKMGLLPDGSEDPSADKTQLPTLGAANDGDGDRNLIAGAGCFVTPSDSLAIIADNWESIPHFAKAGGPKGVARSMPSSAALDVVAKARNFPFFSTPTGWKFFGNLMSSKELFGKTDYTPFLCGEESFGTGSDHIREKDGLWAVLAWMSILMKANEGIDSKFVSVKDVVARHWAKYGRHFYCRYDYEGVDSDAANSVMDLIRQEYVKEGKTDSTKDIKLVAAEEFEYTDPVDGSKASNQGLILSFEYPNGDPARVVFRLSGTGSSGATVRVYLEKYEQDESKFGVAAPAALQSLGERALELVQMSQLTGRDAPTVIT